MASRNRPAAPPVGFAEMAAREQDREVQDCACNGLTMQEVACTGLTVQEGACNGLTATKGNATARRAIAESTAYRALEAEEVRWQGHRDFIEDRPVCSTVQSGYLHPLLPAHAPKHGELLEDIPSRDAPSLSPPPVRPPSRPRPCALPLPPACAPSLLSPLHGRGLIHGTASEALLKTLMAAKRRVLDRVVGQGGSVAAATAAGRGVQEHRRWSGCLGGETHNEGPAHSAPKRGGEHANMDDRCHVAGMPKGNVCMVPTTAALAYALTALQLLDAVQRDEATGLIPFFLVPTAIEHDHLVVEAVDGPVDIWGGGHSCIHQLMAPQPFALVCFPLKPPSARTQSGVACTGVGDGRVGDEVSVSEGSVDVGREVNAAPLEAINSSAQAHLSHTDSAELLAAWLLHSSNVSHLHTNS
ncbi:unnamed protein product [Closterium sp. NIES-64]|nr:unnamed protein product [Closterium sp. NIES-64]